METHELITQEITAAVRPVPWDKSFIPLPAHLSQPSQPPEAEVVTSFMCERCYAFAKWHELNQYWKPSRPNMAVQLLQRLVPRRFEKLAVRYRRSVLWRYTEREGKEISFELYQNWNEFYESYGKGCHLCNIIFYSLSRRNSAGTMITRFS
jgi:hypothetical protein